MPRRELLARMEARMRSYKNEDKKTRASRALAEKIEDMTQLLIGSAEGDKVNG